MVRLSDIKYTRYEKDLLANHKKSRSKYSNEKVCAYKDCTQMGKMQDLTMFRKSKSGHDSYCYECRLTVTRQWKFDNQGYKETEKYKFSPKRVVKTKWNVPVIGTKLRPLCKDHPGDTVDKCGCSYSSMFHKSKKVRAKISATMKGKKNAIGNKSNTGIVQSRDAQMNRSFAARLRWAKYRKEKSNE